MPAAVDIFRQPGMNLQVVNRDKQSQITAREVAVTAIARALARRFQLDETDAGTLKLIVMFCAVGLFITLLFAAYGIDLAFDFF